MQRTVRTPDGRVLAVEESGDPDGRPVLVHMGTPAPRRLYGPHVLACAALLPDRVTAAASLASLAPYGAAGLDYFGA